MLTQGLSRVRESLKSLGSSPVGSRGVRNLTGYIGPGIAVGFQFSRVGSGRVGSP